jgi:hypothetical protein
MATTTAFTVLLLAKLLKLIIQNKDSDSNQLRSIFYLLSNPEKEKRKTKGLNFKDTTHHTMLNLLQLQLIISDSNFSSLQNHNSGFLFFPSDLASAAFLRLKPKAKFTTFCYTFSPTLFIKKIKIKSISL